MLRKIIQVGASAGMIFPKEALKERGLQIGDMADVNLSRPSKHSGKAGAIDPETIQWTNAFIEKYRPALKKLANR